ncbi:2-(R)-hydroxypropyl-CoM dehydrogenase [Lachnellula suecica]|uniref:2-(R)-hydroxypropyl-CoM dehydrogenase n=1 Tax=Lachnellula suecica TaxID=602035 RepID=A0A8T9CH76_9HELO|nr:2-(R)-hydroxypropyl-CoM dehydrogenase [Lachnellula suecica]
MSSRLSGRIACVTGASSGIGRAIALAFAAEGASVMCSDLQPQARAGIAQEGVVATHELIVQQGGKAKFFITDVRDEEQFAALIAYTVKEFGRLDIRMVNNAGIAGKEVQAVKTGGIRLHEAPMKDYDLIMDVNVRGVFTGCKYALAQFLVQEPLPPNRRGDRVRGNIINMASVGGLVGLGGAPIYTASKHAVIGFTKQISLDYALDKIQCNAICPGYADTALISHFARNQDDPVAIGLTAAVKEAHPWGDLGQTEDVAKAAVFLASEDASWITGHPLVVDGGYTAR